jgi:uncharacterized membrane protein YfcA
MEIEKNSAWSITMLLAGTGLSTSLGFISSFFGIGGGFLYVPALVYFLKFPVHTATATSIFILTITALTGSVTHVAAGLFHHGIRRAIGLSRLVPSLVRKSQRDFPATSAAIGSFAASPLHWD